MIKRLIVILLLLFLLCGTASAVTLTIGVFDESNNNPIDEAKIAIAELNTTKLTDTNGQADFSVNSSTEYTISVSKNGYVSKTEKKSSFEPYQSFYLSKESPVIVRVIDDNKNPVANALVFVDGTKAGLTNEIGIIHYPMARNTAHEISVSADLYDNHVESKYISSGDSAYIIQLKKTELSPTLYLRNQNNNPISYAEISIDNGNVFHSDSNGMAELASKYTAGKHSIKIVKKGYETYQSEIFISENNAEVIIKLNYSAIPLNIVVADGKERVSNAVVYIDEKAAGITDDYGIFVSNQIPETTIILSATKDGYTSETTSYNVSEDLKQEVIIKVSKEIPLALIIGVSAGIIIAILIVLLVVLYRSRNNPPKEDYNSERRRESL